MEEKRSLLIAFFTSLLGPLSPPYLSHTRFLLSLSPTRNSLSPSLFSLPLSLMRFSQVEQLQGRLVAADREVHAAREAANQAVGAAGRHEQDLRDLSSAYNQLESHSFSLESQLREAQSKLTALQKASPAGAGSVGGVGGVPEQEVERRVAEARAEAEQAGEEQLTDLLVCLGQVRALESVPGGRDGTDRGSARVLSLFLHTHTHTRMFPLPSQEEAKVALLSEKLSGFGLDVEALLAQLAADEAVDEEVM
jgi:hypothetical protein